MEQEKDSKEEQEFTCRICGCHSWEVLFMKQAPVPSETGDVTRRVILHACSECSVVFSDLHKFMKGK